MTEREALKMALEALEFIPKSGSMLGAQAEVKRLQAITALQEELTLQQLSKPCLCGKQTMAWCMANTCSKAQPEQEPKCGAIIEVFGKDWRLEYLSLPVGKHKLYTQQYTYTTPPQRKPLTDEEALELWNKHEKHWRFENNALAFARAIEAAHGIKGEA